jgi:hypothetical protein
MAPVYLDNRLYDVIFFKVKGWQTCRPEIRYECTSPSTS